MLDITGWIPFILAFALFIFLGFYGARFRKGNLNRLWDWSLAGRKLGPTLSWFLLGADVFTAYTFVAIPSLEYASGAIAFYAVPYVSIVFVIAIFTMPKLWEVCTKKGFVTASDFVKARFNSRSLAIAVALTGVVATLPYIALQIVGMQAVLSIMLSGVSNASTISEIALIISFIILAAFTFKSGLRGVTLGSVMKDILILLTVVVVIIAVPLAYGGFSNAFSGLSSAKFQSLAGVSVPAFFSLFVGSAFALYLYPHIINGSLSTKSRKTLRRSLSLLPIYSIGLGLLALFGVLVYAVPSALAMIKSFGSGLVAVPALIVTTLPPWFAGIALLGIFIGGMVPAAIMAIAASNLLTRNVIGEFRKLTPEGEARLAKWLSAAIKFIALGFVFIVPLTYAVQLQLLGGIIILQTLPPVFLGLFTKRLEWKSLLAGWAAGMISGILFVLIANNYGALSTSDISTGIGLLYIGLIALGINVLVAVLGSLLMKKVGLFRNGSLKDSDFQYKSEEA